MHATASILTETYSSSLSMPATRKAPASVEETDRAHEPNVPDGSCVKGLIVSLGMEAAAVLLFCSIWQAWHLMR